MSIHISIRMSIHKSLHTSIHTSIHMSIHMFVCIFAHVSTQMCICTQMHAAVALYSEWVACLHTCLHTCPYTCECALVHTCPFTLSARYRADVFLDSDGFQAALALDSECSTAYVDMGQAYMQVRRGFICMALSPISIHMFIDMSYCRHVRTNVYTHGYMPYSCSCMCVYAHLFFCTDMSTHLACLYI